MKKPVWFLDVDGVINGWRHTPRVWKTKNESDAWNHVEFLVPEDSRFAHTPLDIHYSPVVIDFINNVCDVVDIVWMTSWAELANKYLVPHLGLKKEFQEGFSLVGKTLDHNDPTLTGFKVFNYYKLPTISELTIGKPFTSWDESQALFKGAPVIWTDDGAKKGNRDSLKSALAVHDVSALTIAPIASVGLAPLELDRIEQFISENT